jgi:predicted NBD/HSP70 family sugar kinase
VRQKATHGQTRTYNSRLVLRTVYDQSPISRAEVARATGLTRTSVSDLVGELLESGLVEEGERGPSTGGKAPILLRFISGAQLVVGVDVAETELRGALVDLRGDIRLTRSLPIDANDADATLHRLQELVGQLIADSDRPILGVGIATPGLIDSRSGVVRTSVHLDWRDLPLGALVSERHRLPVHVANDSQAAALAEYTFGGYADSPNLVAVKVGRGIGAGVILDGHLFVGDGAGAGEIGHTTVADNRLACQCGRTGCLETVAGTRAILGASGAADLTELRRRLDAGDGRAVRVVEEAGRALGRVLGGMIGALDVERIALLGPAAELGDRWLEVVRTEAVASALPLLSDRTQVTLGVLSPDIVVLGASALLLTRELGLALAR